MWRSGHRRARHTSARLGVVVALLLPLAGCAARRVDPYFVRVAEGLTAPTLGEGIRVAPRMFSAAELVRACRDPRRIARLETSSPSLELQIGERFPLATLSVVAVNGADLAVPGVAIAIEAEEGDPQVLQLRSDDPDVNQGRIYALNSGRFRMRIRTMCGTPGAETTIHGRAVP